MLLSSTPCAICGQLLPTGSAQGQCPQCLLKAALEPLETPTEAVQEEQGATRKVTGQTQDSMEGKHIGRYKLLQEIGEGGFGIVYLAQQTEPVKRRVALKVIKPGMDTREVVARFEAERQALALMDHPHIAQIYDGGTTASGRPYFVMELVKGVPLTQYCNEEHLSTRQRLELFLDVLAAVQHAHQKGIIHRDLKPSNILVSPHDGKPVVKVIDFGIAKALNLELTEKTLFTGHGLMIGTPEYMSPEQAELNALDVDTRSDLYSLGVVLYELLTGRTPLDSRRLRQAGYAEIQRMIREEDPPRPSTRLSSLGEALTKVAEQRSVEPHKLTRLVRGELDWIVMKALEKERVRRYETANAFAEDIRRHLADEEVGAGPPSRLYRLKKVVRRYKGLIAAACAVTLALLAGVILSLWQAVEAKKARDLARRETAAAVSARKDQTEQLWHSLLAEAKARRWSHQTGQRFAAIEAVRKAAEIRPSKELQNEAVAALALSDLRPAEVYEGNPDKQPMIALSADFKLHAYTKKDGTIIVCERATMKPLAELPGRGVPVNWTLRFSNDSRWLAAGTCGVGGLKVTVTIWEWRLRRNVLQIEEVSRAACDFLSNNAGLVVGVDQKLRFLTLPEGLESRPPVELPAAAHAVRVSNGGGFVAASLINSARGEGLVALVNVKAEHIAPAFLENGSFVRIPAWHPHREWLAAPCADGLIRSWDATEQTLLQTYAGHLDKAVEVAWSPDGDLLASSSWDGTLKLWDASTGELFVSLDQPLGILQFSADGSRLTGQDGTSVRLFEPAPMNGCRRMHGPSFGQIRSAAWSPGDALLATAGGGKVRLWNASGYEVRRLNFSEPRSVLFDKDGLIVSGKDGIRKWPLRVEDSGNMHRLVLGEAIMLSPEKNWEFAALSQDGALLAAASPQKIGLFDLSHSARPPKFLQGHKKAANIAMNKDGTLIATGTWQGDEVWVWRTDDGEVIKKLPVQGSAHVAFTTDERWLITGSPDEFRCWDTISWEPGTHLPRRDDLGGLIVVSPRGTAAAIDCTRHQMRLVLPDTLATLIDPDCGPQSPLCFSNDGCKLVSTNNQGHLFVWDIAFIRREMARLNLDWDFPQLIPSKASLVE